MNLRGATARVLLGGAIISLVAVTAFAQRRGFGGGGFGGPRVRNFKAYPNTPYDGRFNFVRVAYDCDPSGYWYRGIPSWAHGYPMAEQNLMKIMNEVSYFGAQETINTVTLDDPELFKYPVAYMAEPDYWTMTDKEATALRAYLQKGGFIIFDDFRDDFRNRGAGWANFETQMKRLIPDARFTDLDPSHPIFHSFFEINSFDIIPQAYDRGRAVLRGLFENNDPTKRMLAMVNFNTDVSDYWEFSATGFRPIAEGNEAYKLGVNYVVYSLTH